VPRLLIAGRQGARHEVYGERNPLHPSRRGGERRPGSGLLPVRRQQPLVRREEDRQSAICRFCDTDFLGTDGPGGGRFATVDELAQAVTRCWPTSMVHYARPLLVCTGGEPLLQLDERLIEAFHAAGFEVAIETNGPRLPPGEVDWICVSPKAGADLILRKGNELKLILPQPGAEPEQFEALDFRNFFLQPMAGPHIEENIRLAVRFCLDHPQWRLAPIPFNWRS
jgi:7-carboxy-7-deazaguanine synthase